ncbi:MAG: thioredoxin family protein [Elusimicrobiota bacterium]
MPFFRFFWFVVFVVTGIGELGAEEDLVWFDKFEAARHEATTGRVIFADFQAAWCYSCYYMEHRVLSQAAFHKLAKTMILLKLDVDKREGYELKEKYKVKFLPSYLLLNGSGEELGRIAGEQTEEDFLAQLLPLLEKVDPKPVEKLRLMLEAGKIEQARLLREEMLRSYPALGKDLNFKLIWARVDFQWARAAGKVEEAAEAMETLLDLGDGCELAYDISAAQDFQADVEETRRHALEIRERKKLESLVNRRVFGLEKDRCADLRSPIEALLYAYSALGLKKEWQDTLDRAVKFFGKASKRAGLGKDRNAEDNWRYFLETAKRYDELDKLYPRLIEAYANDYVYSYRYAKHLWGRQENFQALKWIEKANLLAYGVNLISVSHLRAQILSGLGRSDEARELLKREIRANRERFSKEIQKLETLLGRI